jgi:SAM-dependent methyltransferase
MSSDLSISRVKETFENWSLYEAVIQNNYMRHRDLEAALKAIGAAQAEELRIVDLGCGDAWLATHAFRELPVKSYFGVDLSEAAVERAKANLAGWQASADVVCGNLAEFVANQANQIANFVLASNSLHHFDSDTKGAILRDCFRILSPGGIFCWIDPFRNEQESREVYLKRLTDVMLKDWIALPDVARQMAAQHVWDSDYPETEAAMNHLSRQAGFESGERFLHDELFGAWRFLKK